MKLDELKGKVVLLDFWATWCGPCIAAIPHTNELAAKYKDKGLVIIGVCHPQGVEKMAQMAKDKGIKYPVTADKDGTTIKAYKVNSYPDYYFIDRSGNLRIADCANGKVDAAIEALLGETPAVAEAQKKQETASAR
jgi:thiol-disulfide isomerase/thioredoxin